MTVQARNRRFETTTLKKPFREALFIKNFACFAGKKHTLLHETFWAAYCFSKVRFCTLTLYLYLYLFYYLLLLLGTYSTKQAKQSKNPCVVNFTIGFVDSLKSMT